ncbi:MAG: formate--tetrahydrofolate ligase [Candidatus Limiplasma sp.]|nr:formate--tetrahydrofolate ligase [Candidatus Limiplasma sp.]
MATDLEIAREAKLEPIENIARTAGFLPETVSPYGRYVAKIDQRAYADLPQRAKLVLVTAINPTPAGEGKTTVSVALADGMRCIGKNAMLALREPSLGPVFGMKGGATGGGWAQVVPMESINLHFTGDLHAITAANNLLCAMVDNHIQQGNAFGIDPRRVCFRHCLDVNDRQLRHIVQGLGGTQNGMPREDGFDITAASEVMATFCLAADLKELKARLGRIVVARTYQGAPVTAGEVGAAGAMTALLRDAFSPNLIQTIGHTPCLMHGGPFANIAHGCNSVAATRLALRMSDYTVTEAGFGADLGAEKFLDIKCRMNGLWPNVIVLVATVRALKHHGGAAKGTYAQPNPEALKAGMANLLSHVKNIRQVWQTPVVVALNRFATDTAEELDTVSSLLAEQGVACAPCNGWAEGGKGTTELAKLVCEAADANPAPVPSYTYPDDASLADKIRAVATRIYHAADVSFAPQALKDLAQLEGDGYAACPVCIAKTQYSMSDDATRLGAPEGYTLTIRSARLSAGAGFVVAFAGSIIAMPGLPKVPAALGIDVDEQGEITGLF